MQQFDVQNLARIKKLCDGGKTCIKGDHLIMRGFGSPVSVRERDGKEKEFEINSRSINFVFNSFASLDPFYSKMIKIVSFIILSLQGKEVLKLLLREPLIS